MLTVGDLFPNFDLVAVCGGNVNSLTLDNAFINVNNNSYQGMWKVVFFYPKDFTFVCPTEISGFARLYDEFRIRKAQIIGCSLDSEYVHLAWRKENIMLHDVPFPIMSDIKRELSFDLGIIDSESGVTQRAVFIVDPTDVIRFVMVTESSVGRNVDETLRVLDALQTGGLCGCGWSMGDKNLSLP